MLKQVLDLYEILDSTYVKASEVYDLFAKETADFEFKIHEEQTQQGTTEFIYIKIAGQKGKTVGQDAPTIGIIGTLGGIGARPAMTGFVSDGDGALAALSAGLKILRMKSRGDFLDSDVVITTHLCTHAPTIPHFPVPFMGAAVTNEQINQNNVQDEMDCILSVDTTKGNEIANRNGFAISPTIKEGYILKVSHHLLDIVKRTTGELPLVLPLTQQDITPYGNGLTHINSILQPHIATDAPVVGVAITTQLPVAGCATGATHLTDVESAARFAVEVAKECSSNPDLFYDQEEYQKIVELYGTQCRFQTKGFQEKTNIGVLLAGQTADNAMWDGIQNLLKPEFSCIVMGALDGLSQNELPDSGQQEETVFITTKLSSGQSVQVPEEKMKAYMKEKLDMLSEKNLDSVLLLCTHHFGQWDTKIPVIQPYELICSTFNALQAKRIGIVTPFAYQMPIAEKNYQKFNPLVKTVENSDIETVAQLFSGEHVDIVLLDCMRFTKAEGDLFKKISHKKTIVPQSLLVNIAKSII